MDHIVLVNAPAQVSLTVQQQSVIKLVVGRQGPAGADGSSSSMPVVNVTTDITMSVGNIYRVTAGSLVELLLPATATIGQQIIVLGYGLGGFRITQNDGQIIHILDGPNNTTSGTDGYIQQSTGSNAMVELMNLVTNDEWNAKVYGCGFN